MRRVLLAVALLLALVRPAGAATYYVNTASAGGNGTTNDESGPNAAFASLSAAEDALDGTPTEPITILCSTGSGTAADTTAVTISGWTLSAANYLEIKANTGHEAGTSWSTSKYRLERADGTTLMISEDYVRITGLQIGKSSSSLDGQHLINILNVPTTGGSAIYISKCFFKQANNGSYAEPGIYINDADATVYIWNTIVCNLSNSTSGTTGAAIAGVAGTAYVYSSALQGGEYGIRVSGATVTAKNVYAGDTVNGDFVQASGTLTMTDCASEDTTSDSNDGILYNQTAGEACFTNVTAGSQDFALLSTSGLINIGTDTSGDSAPLNFTDDILGTARSTWDIGAYEYATGGAAPPVSPVIWIQNNEVIP